MSEAQAQGPVASMGQGHTKDLRLESLNQGLQALGLSVPWLVQLSLRRPAQARQVPDPTGSTWRPTPRRLPRRRGCLPAGRSQAQEADGAELRGERPTVGPQKLRARPFERTSPEAEPTWPEPESAAAKGPPGRGIYKPVSPWTQIQRQTRGSGSCAEAGAGGSLPQFHALSPKSALMLQPFLPFPDTPLLHFKRCF